jgi:hypothetical protein
VWSNEEIWWPPAKKTVQIGYRRPERVYLAFEIDLSRDALGKDGWLKKKNAIKINGQPVPLKIEGDEEERRFWKEPKQSDQVGIEVTDLIKESEPGQGKKIQIAVDYENPIVKLPKDARGLNPLKAGCSGRLTLSLIVQRGAPQICKADGHESRPGEDRICTICGKYVLKDEGGGKKTGEKKYCLFDGEVLRTDKKCKQGHDQSVTVVLTMKCPQCQEDLPSFAIYCWYCGFRFQQTS